jgi:hypothetical protein
MPVPLDGATRDAILEQMRKNIDMIERQAREMAERAPDDKTLTEVLERLKEARRRLQEQQPLLPDPPIEGDAAP